MTAPPLLIPSFEIPHAVRTLAPMSPAHRANILNHRAFIRQRSLDIPIWRLPGYTESRPGAGYPKLVAKPWWIRQRGMVLQPGRMGLKPEHEVLFHLGEDEDEGLGKGFHPGKALSRFTHVTKTSFTPKHMLGALGSFTGTVLTGGLLPFISPKMASAHSHLSQDLGIGALAVGGVAGGAALAPGLFGSMGSGLMGLGRGAMGLGRGLFGGVGRMFGGLGRGFGGMFGGGGGYGGYGGFGGFGGGGSSVYNMMPGGGFQGGGYMPTYQGMPVGGAPSMSMNMPGYPTAPGIPGTSQAGMMGGGLDMPTLLMIGGGLAAVLLYGSKQSKQPARRRR